jgi:hypothetical protein
MVSLPTRLRSGVANSRRGSPSVPGRIVSVSVFAMRAGDPLVLLTAAMVVGAVAWIATMSRLYEPAVRIRSARSAINSAAEPNEPDCEPRHQRDASG